jgi:imidazolonepropionase-like amidohydrolase
MTATRTVFAGGTVFDGTGAPPAPADVAVEGGRVVEVGPGLDGDELVDCTGQAVLPGLFDCHVHVTVSAIDQLAMVQAPFSLQFYAAGTEGIKAAVRNGVRSIEHGDFLDDEAIAMMLECGTWLVPTLIAGRGVLAAADAGVGLGDHIVEKARLVVAAQEDSFRRAVAAGVRIAMGTDSGVTPHGQNLDELPLLVQAGMTAAQALHAATLSAAELLGLERELGSLEPGKRADLVVVVVVVVVDGDPLQVASLAARVRRVYQDGRLVHHAPAVTPAQLPTAVAGSAS